MARTPRWRRWPFLVLVLGCFVAAAVGGALWLRGDDGPDHPNAWGSRVQEYADVVEDQRDLEFKHPIYVDFLSVKAFKKQVTSDEHELSDKDREDIKQSTSMFRALGLIEGEIDLFATMNELRGAGVVGYYDYESERIRIRGTRLTPTVQSTLVHELTHALQDQHFDLEKRTAKLDKADDSAASSAFDSLVEGDASRIETAWREDLSKAEQKALDKAEAGQTDEYKADSAEIPDVLETIMGAPYALGEALLKIAVQDGGERAVDKLFRLPPTTEEHQLDPWTLVEDAEKSKDVPAPTLAKGEKKFDDGPFGALSWLLVLAERIPVKQALDAADGWGGDAYVAYERDGVSCVKVAYEGETGNDLDQMQDALTAWTKRLPDGPASVRRDGSTLVLQSCDPGSKAPAVATGGSQEAITLALSRTYLSAAMVSSGLDTSTARCGADLLIHEFTLAEISDASPSAATRQRAQLALASCRE